MATAQACSESLGPAQQRALDGPDSDVAMTTYVCAGCDTQFPDTGLYFYGVGSVKCIWCAKFPKGKQK